MKNDEIYKLFKGLTKGKFYKYLILLRNIRFYDQYKHYQDAFDI